MLMWTGVRCAITIISYQSDLMHIVTYMYMYNVMRPLTPPTLQEMGLHVH